MAAIQEAKECFMNNVVNNGGLNGSTNGAEVKDITSMVKSKRKISGPQEDVAGMKKTRLSANGAPSSTNGEENGEQMQTSEATGAAPAEIQPETAATEAAAAAPETAQDAPVAAQ